jgi:phosphonopyruvate decarboxylase
MIDQKIFVEYLRDEGVTFITGVPDTLLNDFCLYIEKYWTKEQHVIAANEGNAVALAAGYHLASGSVPLVYMQNSGLGNTVNPLLSLTHPNVYAIPMILLIGWRGEPGTKDHAQHKKQGELTPVLIEAMDIPYKILTNNLEESLAAVKWAIETANQTNSPVALLAGKGVLEKGEKENPNDDSTKLSREEAIRCIIESVPKGSIFVATTGRATRELHALRDILGDGHNTDFLNVGAMGHTSSIATGIALANKKRLVICLDGDSAAIMHLGSLTTVGKIQPPNFLHVILNNGVHESVGGQPSAGYLINFTAIAENSGYVTPGKAVEKEQDIRELIKYLSTIGKPAFIDIHIRQGIRSNLPPLKISHSQLKDDLMKRIIDL